MPKAVIFVFRWQSVSRKRLWLSFLLLRVNATINKVTVNVVRRRGQRKSMHSEKNALFACAFAKVSSDFCSGF